jgi:hypothetical protein
MLKREPTTPRDLVSPYTDVPIGLPTVLCRRTHLMGLGALL